MQEPSKEETGTKIKFKYDDIYIKDEIYPLVKNKKAGE